MCRCDPVIVVFSGPFRRLITGRVSLCTTGSKGDVVKGPAHGQKALLRAKAPPWESSNNPVFISGFGGVPFNGAIAKPMAHDRRLGL
ncbi:hypothetical protein CHS0354_041865 [Potamilus streckersoni]|uniref:Uncharacterized protein n=1 Tax=Potamilus streckersoni TaxID=2493646 RepID=A0AAE0W108_9BIVA|nr:hypothetical protein CHS0354_041865 [Potamilus streckersoni]